LFLLNEQIDLGSGIQLNLKKSNTLAKAKVWKYSLWRHGDEENVKREQAIVQLGSMLKGLIGAASKKRLKLAPFIGIGCPGVIEEDGSIDRGAQNLPGNWESSKFNLPLALYEWSRQLESMRRRSCCITMLSSKGLVKSRSCRTCPDGVF
jgi:hypothetical protein